MIKNWIDIIEVVKKVLKPNGYFCVSDFTELDDFHSKFMKYCFKYDGVMLDKEHIKVFNDNFQLIDITYRYGGFPLIPFVECPYYYGVWKNSKC
jgi:hypothetical protein